MKQNVSEKHVLMYSFYGMCLNVALPNFRPEIFLTCVLFYIPITEQWAAGLGGEFRTHPPFPQGHESCQFWATRVQDLGVTLEVYFIIEVYKFGTGGMLPDGRDPIRGSTALQCDSYHAGVYTENNYLVNRSEIINLGGVWNSTPLGTDWVKNLVE